MPYEVVDDDKRAPDSVMAWLALELETVHTNHGEKLFLAGVPTRRRMLRPAIVRHVFVDGGAQVGGEEVAWDNDVTDHPMAVESVSGDARVEEREIYPAHYEYEAPRVLAILPPQLARWAYENFRAAELDSMYRLRDNPTSSWMYYVEELREGAEAR